MTPERLERLAEAWGADPRRWPASERVAALVLLARDAGARNLLARAAELDALLDTHAVAAPGDRLVEDVLASAPAGRSGSRAGAGHRRLPRRGWWWSGAGIAGVGLAGTASGAIAVALALSVTSGSSALQFAPASPTLHGGWSTSAFDTGNTLEGSEE